MNDESLISGLQNQDLRIQSKHLDDVRRFTMTRQSEAKRNKDKIPFERFVDIWWLSMCIGVQEGRREKLSPSEWHTFARAGEVLPSNAWRIFHLQLLAVGVTGSTDILSKPREIISMANEFAATGLPILLNEITTGSEVPIWAATNFVSDRLKSGMNLSSD